MRSLNFLIVDDSVTMIRNLTFMLTQLGHNVVGTARSGMSAINEYKKCSPDIITMDITMPDMNGIKATEKILEKHPEAIIIMITAIGLENMVIEAIAKGAKAYLIKPVNSTSLNEMIEKIYENYIIK